MPSPYYVQPGGDISQGLSGLSQVIGEVRERKQAKKEQMRQQARMEAAQEEIYGAMQSGDPMEVARVSLQYPEFQETISQTLGTLGETQANEERQFLTAVLSNPENAKELYEQRIQKLESQGRDATHTRQSYQDYLQNPQEEIRRAEMLYAMQFPDEYSAFKKATAEPELGAVAGVKSFVDQNGAFVGTYDLTDPRDRAFVLANNLIEAPSRLEQGEPGSFGTASQRGKLQIELNDQAAAVQSFGDNGRKLIEKMVESPDANTSVATLARYGRYMKNEAEALGRQAGLQSETVDSLTDKFDSKLEALGLDSAEMKAGVMAIALNVAAASGLGSGRALTDKDIDRALSLVGGNMNDPVGMRAIMTQTFDQLSTSVNNRATAQKIKIPELNNPFSSEPENRKPDFRYNPDTGEVEPVE